MSLYDNYLRVQPTRGGEWLQRRRAQAEWQIIHRLSPGLKNFLEIGPGHGVMAGLVCEAGCAYLALESNEQIARYVRWSGYRVCMAFVPPYPVKSRSIDVVYAAHVIEHMPNPQAALLFAQEAHRTLRDGGLLFLTAPDMRAFGRDFWDSDYTHSFPITLRRLRQLLPDANFEIVQTLYFSGPIQGPASALASILVKVLPSDPFFLSRELGEHLARLRLTFLRNICVVASKR